jgi:hypothetical protein
VLVDRVAWLASGSPNPQVRAIASARLRSIGALLVAARASDEAEAAHRRLLSEDIKRLLDHPGEPVKPIVAPDAPPGAPIGGDVEMDWLARPAMSSGR